MCSDAAIGVQYRIYSMSNTTYSSANKGNANGSISLSAM
jgi:hypothetical protein